MFENIKGLKDYKTGVSHIIPLEEGVVKIDSPFINSEHAKYMVFKHAQEIKYIESIEEYEKQSESLTVEFADITKNLILTIDDEVSAQLSEQEQYYLKKQKYDDYRRLTEIAAELSEIDAMISTRFELFKSTCEKEWNKRKGRCFKYLRGIHEKELSDKRVVFDFSYELTTTKFKSFVEIDNARKKIISVNYKEAYLNEEEY